MLERAARREPAAVKLVRDPVCGVFVVPAQGADERLGHGDAVLLFREMPPAVEPASELRKRSCAPTSSKSAAGCTRAATPRRTTATSACGSTPDRLLMTPTSVCKGFMTAEMMCITDLDGTKLAGERDPSSEMQMHLEVYRQRPDVQAVVHAHPPIATGFAVAGIPLDRAVLAEVVTTLGQRADRRVRDAVDEGAAGGSPAVRAGARRHAARQPRRADARQGSVLRVLQDGDDRALREDQPGRAAARRRAAAVARGGRSGCRVCAAATGSRRRRRSAPTRRRAARPTARWCRRRRRRASGWCPITRRFPTIWRR